METSILRKELIITGANTAREINPHGKEPQARDYSMNKKFYAGVLDGDGMDRFKSACLRWQDAESSLKEYRIHGVYLKNSLPDRLTRWNRLHISTVEKLYPIGSTHKCEVSEETLTAIIL